MTTPTHRTDRASKGVQLRELAGLVAVTHMAVVVLDLTGHATYPGASVLGLLADHPAWMTLHLAAAVAIAATVTARRVEWLALCCSATVLGGWSLLDLVWRATQSPDPVPLLGPVLGLIVTALSLWLAHYWID